MPELPEVETIKRELQPKLINQKIRDCVVLREDIIGYPKAKRFCTSIIDEAVLDVSRTGKYLVINLTSNKRLIFHLRLSGAIILRNIKAPSEKFTRLIIKLDDYQLFFNEPRALGRAYLLENGENPEVLKGFFCLGREPLASEFDFEYFKKRIKGRKARIKTLLLDQNICAGVGNIYSDEALFLAGIRPLRRANRLKTEEIFKLLNALRNVLKKAISNFGTSVSDYRRTDGEKGNFQNFLNVYAREGEPCHKCGTEIVVKKISNRGSRYCPKCQK